MNMLRASSTLPLLCKIDFLKMLKCPAGESIFFVKDHFDQNESKMAKICARMTHFWAKMRQNSIFRFCVNFASQKFCVIGRV